MSSDRAIGDGGFSGSPEIGCRKAWSMIKFPRPDVRIHFRNLGHPVRLAGKNGKRLRVKSKAAGVRQ